MFAEKVGIWRNICASNGASNGARNGARKAQILAKNGARIAQVGAKAQSKIDYIYYMGAECSIKLTCKIPGDDDSEYDELGVFTLVPI